MHFSSFFFFAAVLGPSATITLQAHVRSSGTACDGFLSGNTYPRVTLGEFELNTPNYRENDAGPRLAADDGGRGGAHGVLENPLDAAAPSYLAPMLLEIVALMSTNEKALVVGLNTPTPSALYGAKTTRPLLAVAAPLKLPAPLLMVLLRSTSDIQFVIGLNTPMPPAL